MNATSRQIVHRSLTGSAVCVLLTALSTVLHAQEPKGISRIGFLSRDLHPADSRAPVHRRMDEFRQGLRELGYVEGKNLLVEYRYADGRFERLPALAEELVRLNVQVIVTDTAAPARAAKKVTSIIPIVVISAGNPLQTGLVASLSRPEGNVTGLTSLTSELHGKRLELLKEAVPKVSRFAFLDDDDRTDHSPFKYAHEAAQNLGVKLDRVEVKTSNPDFEGVFRAMVNERIGALITSAGVLNTALHRKEILRLAAKNHMPAMHSTDTWITDGGLMYYGTNTSYLYRRAAIFVDKILKGAKPGDLPFEQPTKFEFVINLKAAKHISVTIPPHVLARADRVIR